MNFDEAMSILRENAANLTDEEKSLLSAAGIVLNRGEKNDLLQKN